MDDKINLTEILEQHKLWLADNSTGKQANLREANLREANLREADLQGADLQEANLREAKLQGANLRGADLREADLQWADLWGADLRGADLRGADLREAKLQGANLQGAKNIPTYVSAVTTIVTADTKTGWKKLQNDCIAQLSIPPEAKRSTATTRKCRCEYADVVSIWDKDGNEVQKGISQRDHKFIYRVGERVTCDKWDDDRWNECSGGIHFFLTREEAEAY